MRIYFTVIILLAISCNTNEKGGLISKTETLSRILNGELQKFKFAPYKNEDGEPMSKTESTLLNKGKLTRRYYQDNKDEVLEVRCLPMKEEDLFYEIRLTEFLSANPLQKIDQRPMECSTINIDSIYNALTE